MQKNKIRKMVLALTVALGITTMASGCSLVSVNPERDNARVIAEIDGQQLTKDRFNNFMAYYEMISGDQKMPAGKELEGLKKDVLDSLMQTEAMAAKAKKDGESVDEAAKIQEAEADIKALKESAGKKYDNILKSYHSNDEAFSAFMKDLSVKNAYASKASEKYFEDLEAHPEKELDQVVGKIGGEEIKKGEYNYYRMLQDINGFMAAQQGMQNQEPSEEEKNEEIFEAMAKNKGLVKYCEDNGIEVTEEAIRSAQTSKQSSLSMIFPNDEQLNTYLKQTYLSREEFDAFQKADAKAEAAGKAIEKKMQEEAKVSDGEVQKYFKENADAYAESTVSAAHILTEDEAYANEIYEKAKDITSKEAFQNLMDSYQGDELVKEAADLGAFNREKMVKEFSDAAFSMDKDTVSKPVKSEFGYHVIYVYDKKDSKTPSLDDYRDEIRESLKEEKGAEAYTKFVDELNSKEKVEINEIKTPLESFMDTLKDELKITIHEKVIK